MSSSIMSSIFSLSFVDAIKDRMFEYFWKKYLGEFLLDGQSLKSSKWTFSDGKLCGQIGNIYLDSAALNARISNFRPTNDDVDQDDSADLTDNQDSLDLPIIFTEHAYLGQIEAEVPWSSLLAEDCRIKIDGARFEMRLNVSPSASRKPAIEQLMASSMDFDLGSPSLQIAEELIENAQIDARKQDSRLEGLEMLANVIESVLRRVQFTITDTSFVLVDKKGRSKLDFHIERAVWGKEEEELQQQSSHEDADHIFANPEAETASSANENSKVLDEKFVRTIQITGVQVSLNGRSICKLDGQHNVRLTLGDSKSIHVFINSLIYTILTPQQLHDIMTIFETPDDAFIVDPKLINFQDLLNQKLITEQDYRRIEQQLQLEKNEKKIQLQSSSNLNAKINQIWSTSGTEQDDQQQETFYPFTSSSGHNSSKGLCDDADNTEDAPFVDVFVEVPGIVFCLLNNTADSIEAVLPNFSGEMQSISRHLDEKLSHLNHLRLCLLNGQVILHPDRINCTLSDILFSECDSRQFEHILFNEKRDKRDSNNNLEFEYVFVDNEMRMKSSVPTWFQFDLTLVERLESFLQLNNQRSVFDLSESTEELDAVRVDRQKLNNCDLMMESEQCESNPLTFKFDFPDLTGRMFFPIPDMREKTQKTFSKIRDQTLEAVFKNCQFQICGKQIKIDSDFVGLALNTKYVEFKRLQKLKYLAKPLLHLNQDSRISEMMPSILEALTGVQLAQFRSLGPNSRVEFTLDFGPAFTYKFLDNLAFKAKAESCRTTAGLSGTMEDSLYANAASGLKSERPNEFQSKRRIVKEQEQVEQIVTPNDRQQSSDYLNCASLVSEMVVQLAIPQIIAVFTDQEQLNNIYNRFANDIALWKPFNLYVNAESSVSAESPIDEIPVLASNVVNQANKVDKFDLESEFRRFDSSVHRIHQEHNRSQSGTDGSNLADTDNEWDPNINIADFSNDDDDFHHFEISDSCKPITKSRTFKSKTPTYFICKSGLEESSDSEVSFHSTAESPVDHLEYFTNSMTLICKVRETVISFESLEKGTDQTEDKQTQNLVGSHLLVGCVLGMTQPNTSTRVFLHADELNLCVASKNAVVTRTQAVSSQNRQVRLITGNKLVHQRQKCKLNAGFEIAFESPKVKRIRIAIQLQHGLLLQPNTDQFGRFWQFLNVTDDLIEGYEPAKVLVELHVDLVDTAVMLEHACQNLNPAYVAHHKQNLTACFDCQHPLQLQHRPALIVCDELNITCLLLEGTDDTLLRLIFEEAALMFVKQVTDMGDLFPTDGKQCFDRFYRFGSLQDCSTLTNALQLDRFVCAVNCDLLELNVKISNGRPSEICLNNNMINIRSCADLLAALCCFSQRFTSAAEESTSDQSQPKSTLSTNTAAFKTIETQLLNNVKSSVIINRPYLFDEKILEDEEQIPQPSTSKKPCNCDPISDFSIVTKNESGKLTITNRSTSPQSLDESSFFILGDDDFGTGIKKSPEPEIRCLSDGPVSLKETYFVVPKQSNTPSSNENNETRFLLDEMSICLHLYGGRDFYEDYQAISGKNVDPRAKTFDTSLNVNKPTVRFADASDQKIHLDDAKYMKQNAFDLAALNFGRTLEFYALSGSQNRNQALWEDLDLFQSDVADSFLSHANKASNSSSSSFDPTSSGSKGQSLSAAKTAGGFARNQSLYVKTFLMKLRCLVDTYLPVHPVAWRFLFSVHEVEVRDCVRNSQINKMLYEYTSDRLPRRNNHMLAINAITWRVPTTGQTVPVHAPGEVQSERNPDEFKGSEECELKISLKPLRINIDQDTIMFIIEYFNQLSLYLENACAELPSAVLDESCADKTNFADDNLFADNSDLYEDQSDVLLDYQQNLLNKKRSSEDLSDTCSVRSGVSISSSRDLNRRPLFIRNFVFSPDVPIKLDYQGKRVDFEQGPIAGILIGLAQLNQSELTLKRIHHKYGILGFEKVFLYALNCWLQDIKKHQLPSILGGVGPVHSFVQLFQGIRDLFWLPIDQYRRDRRIVRGLQRGLFSFSTCSTIALLELSSRTLRLIEFTAQSAHDLMSGSSLRRERMLSARYESGGRMQQPRDVREGALSAYNVISDGFYQAFRNLTVGRSRHNSSAIAHIIRELPANVLLPIIHSSQATSNVLLGVRNQMTPQARKEDEDKWKA